MVDLADISVEQAASTAGAALRRGDFLAAYDCAVSVRDAGVDDPRLAFIAALALARMGDSHLAIELYEQAGLGAIDNDDYRALGARIKKDLAQLAPGGERQALFAEASAAYRAIFDDLGGYFPAINAATTALLAGDEAAARELATKILKDPEIRRSESYYAAASAAEAHVLLGDGAAALEAIARA
ncbi:MAG: adenylate cyclase, partial [Sphingomonadaceae bacterium]|nr:adenylate cyclase [Sphingomonadaceae bacterium]